MNTCSILGITILPISSRNKQRSDRCRWVTNLVPRWVEASPGPGSVPSGPSRAWWRRQVRYLAKAWGIAQSTESDVMNEYETLRTMHICLCFFLGMDSTSLIGLWVYINEHMMLCYYGITVIVLWGWTHNEEVVGDPYLGMDQLVFPSQGRIAAPLQLRVSDFSFRI